MQLQPPLVLGPHCCTRRCVYANTQHPCAIGAPAAPHAGQQQPAKAIAATHQSGPRCLCLLLSASTRERISGPSSAAYRHARMPHILLWAPAGHRKEKLSAACLLRARQDEPLTKDCCNKAHQAAEGKRRNETLVCYSLNSAAAVCKDYSPVRCGLGGARLYNRHEKL